MTRAIQVKAPAMNLADVDWRKMPGCSTIWVMFATLSTPGSLPAIDDITDALDVIVVPYSVATEQTQSNDTNPFWSFEQQVESS